MSVDICPKCGRKLLTHSSAKCNWCGEVVPDEGYQQEATVEREVFYVQQRLHDAAELAAIEAINPLPFSGTFPLGGIPYAGRPPIRPLPFNQTNRPPLFPRKTGISPNIPDQLAPKPPDEVPTSQSATEPQTPAQKAEARGKHLEL